jgi:hypothetical protein
MIRAVCDLIRNRFDAGAVAAGVQPSFQFADDSREAFRPSDNSSVSDTLFVSPPRFSDSLSLYTD